NGVLSKGVLSFDNFVPYGVADQFGDGLKALLVHDVGWVRFDCLDAASEHCGNLSAGLAFGHQLHNLPFAWSQTASRASGLGPGNLGIDPSAQWQSRGFGGEERPVLRQ